MIRGGQGGMDALSRSISPRPEGGSGAWEMLREAVLFTRVVGGWFGVSCEGVEVWVKNFPGRGESSGKRAEGREWVATKRNQGSGGRRAGTLCPEMRLQGQQGPVLKVSMCHGKQFGCPFGKVTGLPGTVTVYACCPRE